jgi:hypothetical protein
MNVFYKNGSIVDHFTLINRDPNHAKTSLGRCYLRFFYFLFFILLIS